MPVGIWHAKRSEVHLLFGLARASFCACFCCATELLDFCLVALSMGTRPANNKCGFSLTLVFEKQKGMLVTLWCMYEPGIVYVLCRIGNAACV